MIFIVVIFFMFAAMLAVVSNEDIFSPSKLFLFFFMAFHLGALFSDISEWTATLIFVVLCVGILAVMYEADRLQRCLKRSYAAPATAPRQTRASGHVIFIWAATLPPLLAQFYMIDYFGGIQGYVNSVALRVSEWAGLGWARALIALIVPVNLVYFGFGLAQRRDLRWWALYALHFILLLAFGALSGSRSSLLNVFVMQLIIFHYLRTPIKGRMAALLAAGLVFAAMALGVIRESVKFDQGELVTASVSSERTLSFASFYYGVDPLEMIARTEYMPLAEGSTFLSLFTNAIPRDLWPDKPDTGGVFFTKHYTNDAWEGFSNLTPTFLGEWIINFGWIFGIIGFVIAYFVLMTLVVNYYFRIMTRLSVDQSASSIISFIIYVQIMWGIIALMVGETTNVLLNLFLSQLLPLWLMKLYVTKARL